MTAAGSNGLRRQGAHHPGGGIRRVRSGSPLAAQSGGKRKNILQALRTVGKALTKLEG